MSRGRYGQARSRAARKGATGRKVHKKRVIKVKVHHRRPRRYAGIRGGSRVLGVKRSRKARVSKTGRHRKFHGRRKSLHRAKRGAGTKRVLKGRHGHRKFHGRRKSTHKRHLTHKRVMRKGLKRHFKGRKKSTHKRHLTHKVVRRKGLKHPHKGSHTHRRFLGRRKSIHKRAYHGRRKTLKPKLSASTAPISAGAYTSMF